jgi:RNA polymerase sigma factor (TIGR02999 family)
VYIFETKGEDGVMGSQGDVTSLLIAITKGDPAAEPKLIPLVYAELRKLAGHYMQQERPDHTLQATALVHEAYLRLVRQQEVNWQSKAHFFAIAGRVMRRILVDHARAHTRGKRGGRQQPVPLDQVPLFSEPQSEELLDLDRALTRFAEQYPRQSQIVEMRFFGGLPVEEIAEILNISEKTAKRDWSLARAWLHRELSRATKTDDARTARTDS